MMHRIRAGAAALLLACAGATTCLAQEPGATAARDIQTIIAAGELRVAMTRFDLGPFHRRRADGSVVGREVDLVRQLADALKVKLVLVGDAGSFDAVVETVARGRADIGISKLSQTYGRLLQVRFSQPYVTLRHALLYDRAAVALLADGRPPESVLRTFAGRIGVIAGSAYVGFARQNFPAAQVVELPNWNEVVAALKAERVDVIYRDEFEIRNILKSNPALNIRYGSAAMTDQFAFLSIAICNTCTKLQETVNYHLTSTRGAFTLINLLTADLSN